MSPIHSLIFLSGFPVTWISFAIFAIGFPSNHHNNLFAMKGLNTVVVPVAISQSFLPLHIVKTFSGIFFVFISQILSIKSSNVIFSHHSPIIDSMSSLIFVTPFALGQIMPFVVFSLNAMMS